MYKVGGSKLWLKTSVLIFANILTIFAADGDVFVEVDGLRATLGNGLINITFTENAQVSSLIKNGVNLVGDVSSKTFYLDWNGGKGVFKPVNINILNNTTDMVHIMYYQPGGLGLLRLENHFLMLKGVSGVYQYVKASNPENDTLDISELRTVHRFNHKLMSHVSNGHVSGDTPDLTDRPTIQDTTWQLKDGTYWSKYDYCAYIRETPWFGVFGGGFGAWVISASREYHSGGPLKQDLLVHHDSLSANYLTSSHYGTPNHQAIPGWSKFFGPWLVYINDGKGDNQVLENVSQYAKNEQEKWPYPWVSDEDYPLMRGSLSGQVHGQVNSAVILYSSLSEPFDLQTKGYLYDTRTDENGNFTLKSIRPGRYHLVAYPVSGHASEILAVQNITINVGAQDAGTLQIPVLTDILWNIGETNRRSDSFRYSDEPRNFYWHTLPPANLTYTIGTSNEAKDWYYAQTRNGTWNIVFNDTHDNNARVLRVAFAAASGSLIFNTTKALVRMSVNGYNVGEFEYENDKAIYRDALQSGNFHAEKITIDAAKVLDGENVVSITILDGMVMYDAVSYQRLTSDPKASNNFI